MLTMNFLYLRPLFHTTLCETLYYTLKVFDQEKIYHKHNIISIFKSENVHFYLKFLSRLIFSINI